MTVIVMETAPDTIRGEMTRWFLELKPGVFVGKVNARIRELLWRRICATDQVDGAVLIYSSPTEQGFEMVVHGIPKRSVTDFEGVQLITVSGGDEQTKQSTNHFPEFPFDITFLDE